MVDRMMTSSMTSRDLQRPVISKMARDRDSILMGHHLPPQPYIKAVEKINLADVCIL